MKSLISTLKGFSMHNRPLRVAVFVAAAGLGVAACTQDLDITNPNQPNTGQFWLTSADAIKGINAVYNGLLNNGTYGRWLGFGYDIRSDEGYSTSPWTDLSNFNKFTQSDYNFEPSREIFQHHYQAIFRANQVIDRVPGINMDATLRSRIVGEAQFIRALLYFNLVNLYGGNIPLVIKTPNPGDFPPSSTVADVYAQIEKDLTEAAAALPPSYTGSDVGRATRGAALAMLGKAQLQQGKWTAAQATLAQVIGMPQYDLMPNYKDNFTDAQENNKESVFEVQFGDETQLSSGVRGQNYAKMIGACGPGFCDGLPTQWYFDQFFPNPSNRLVYDPRLNATIFWNRPDTVGGGDVYGQSFQSRYGATSSALYWKKWGEYYVPGDQNWDNPINYRVIRFADVLLMEAEATNEAAPGNSAAAAVFVNRVRARPSVNQPPLATGLTQAQMRAAILKERLLELGLEQTRWLDVKRQAMLKKATLLPDDAEFSFFVDGKSELLPIPQAEIDLNPNVKQNPGW
ncbi:MAG: RagB/SusD family nutrient uptake outer membrane protein [Gemmatimonadaceae bacterium]